MSEEEVPPEQRPDEGEATNDTPVAKKEDGEPAEDATSRRDAIRARLREREARLTNLVRTTSGDGAESFIGQMRSVKENLDKMEKEKQELESELNRLKASTDGDDYLTEKMTGIQEGFMKQVKTIQKLEDEIVAKKNETDHLRDELVSKLRRIVELEFDLETHDVHYTDYASEQFKLGEEALAEIKMMEKMALEQGLDPSSEDMSGQDGDPNKMTPRRAQKLISKLLADLDILEARYKEEKLNNASEKQQLTLANEELRTRIIVLERKVEGEESTKDADVLDNLTEAEKVNIDFLRKRVETLEAKRTILRDDAKKLSKSLEETKEESKAAVKKAEFDVDRLSLENEAMKKRIEALETDIQGDDGDYYAKITQQIQENYEDIAKLEASVSIKDRQLATLKKDITKLRLKENSKIDKGSSHKNKGLFGELDSELIRESLMQEEGEVAMAGGEEGASYVRELQRQLQTAQQQLVKKDQELVIERAKAASTAAGLLARIAELNGKMQQADDMSVMSARSREGTPSSKASKDGGDSAKKGGKRRGLRFMGGRD